MTGTQLKKMRDALACSPHGWSALLGVHVSTVYRWEARRGEVEISTLHQQILSALQIHMKRRSVDGLAERIRVALISRDNISALRELLNFIEPEGRQ